MTHRPKAPWKRACDSGSCVEVAVQEYRNQSTVRVRQSDNQNHIINYTLDEWRAFVAGVKNGEFDV